MNIIRTDKQKDNLAKVFWDMGKIIFGVHIISPLARPELLSVGSFVSGLIVGGFSWVLGYLIDGKEVQQ